MKASARRWAGMRWRPSNRSAAPRKEQFRRSCNSRGVRHESAAMSPRKIRDLSMNPLTGLYAAATAARNSLFDSGVLKSRRLERPVVSVGNLSAGGTGKTPFVIALGELLKAREIRFDVLSRGYGRKTRGVLVVGPNGTAADFGDEPLLIARRLGVPVIVGERRYDAGLVAEQKFQSQLPILD